MRFLGRGRTTTMLTRLIVALLVTIAPLLIRPADVSAQQSLDVKAPPPARERIAPAVPERDLYPQRPSLPQQPHFFSPLSRDSETGRAGVAGFTAPSSPVGSRVAGDHDNPGWPGAGFAAEWGRSGARPN